MASFWHQRKSFWLTLAYRQLIGGAMARGDSPTRCHKTPRWDPEASAPARRSSAYPNADAEAAFLGDDADFPDSPDQQAGHILVLEPVEAGGRVGGDGV
jgi:hypothetical protein